MRRIGLVLTALVLSAVSVRAQNQAANPAGPGGHRNG